MLKNVNNWRNFIYNLMAEMGQNQVEFAKSIGVTQSCVSCWLKGKAVPNEEHRRRIAKLIR